MVTYRFPFHPTSLGALELSAATMFENARPSGTVRHDQQRAFGSDMSGNDGAGFPRVDAREDATGFTLELDIPGVAPEAIEVLTEEQLLLVRGSKAPAELRDGERPLLAERSSGAFERRWRFPRSADLNTVSASYQNGVLTLRIAKIEPAQPRKISVAVATA